MAVGKTNRLSKVAREFNVGINTIVEFLHKKGFEVKTNPNEKVSEEMYRHIQNEYSTDLNVRKKSEELGKQKSYKETISIEDVRQDLAPSPKEEKAKPEPKTIKTQVPKTEEPKIKGKIDLDQFSKKKPAEQDKKEEPKVLTPKEEEVKAPVEKTPVPKEPEKTKEGKKTAEAPHIPTAKQNIEEPKVVGKIDVDSFAKTHKAKAPVKDKPAKTKGDIESPKVSDSKTETTETRKKAEPEAIAQKPKQSKPTEQPVAKSETKENAADTEVADNKVVFKPTEFKKLSGPTVVGKIDLPVDQSRSENAADKKKKKRKRIRKDKERVNINEKSNQPAGQRKPASAGTGTNKPTRGSGTGRPQDANQRAGQAGKGSRRGGKPAPSRRPVKAEISEEDVQKQIKETLARLTATKGKSKASRYRRDKRDAASQRQIAETEAANQEKNVIKVTEFVTVAELATMMDVQVNQIIASCMSLGLFVSINQRLDAETISLVAEEFDHTVEFISVEVAAAIEEDEIEDETMLEDRSPIVTVMGHVDHGKTSLLDHIRKANVIQGEAGGITQHIGAYSVTLESNRKITFLDTPGHEAFTAMRARGAQVTDIAIIIIAADDNVMPQTVEAINHASAAGVPIVFAINKIDKPGANPDKIKEELANMNYLVEDWGGKYQCQEISAKNGLNIDELLEKVLLEADLLELKAVKDKRAVGSVIESSLDKGRGFVTTVLVQSGTLKVGDVILAGSFMGHVKAMFNERNQKVDAAGPSEPVLMLGLNGAAQAGEKFNVMESERDAKEITNKRTQLQREQGMRTKKHITLDEIGRRIAIGNFQELNVIVKGDVDGSIEALSDSLIKLSTDEIQVNVIHKAVGQISESDIMLAAASNAIVIGFQVRPSLTARKIAEKEEIDIRLYSIIYDAIEELKLAMEGMLSPEIKEQINATLEVRETFKITKVGTIAGCMVKDGKIKRNSKVRLIREGIVIYTGVLGALKRFKDDVKEVASGYECGVNIANYNDIKEGDIIEAFEEVEVSRTL
ncbi:bacterial translation initiation factor 2 (bIF-2) [Saccharicrinis carchari]|uniref:Translation initiation factor IF-2 n=1 Tax=Saccharicrinis carchari TaxID=1168039 RepID=A0A521F1R4_SACCC|nr:translation initiation factor IF-2 [Saccharicrinis carchari]SMO90119.1 bacterial translation initiation factor 2 (bIF-2) [Saccharicrinis carchari]